MVGARSLGIQPEGVAPPLQWVDGVVFNPSLFPPSEPVVKEMLEGRLHWAAVEFALCPEYQPAMRDEGPKVTVPLVNVSHNRIFAKMAQQLKSLVHGSIEGESP